MTEIKSQEELNELDRIIAEQRKAIYRNGTVLTRREKAAIAAMQGILAATGDIDYTESRLPKIIARESVILGDALLEELERTR